MKTRTKLLLATGVLGLASVGPMRDTSPNPVALADVMVSDEGESLKSFVGRVGQRMEQLSESEGFEYCGELGWDDKRYGIDITTSRAHVGCVIDMSAIPSGLKDMGETMHNHGNGKAFRVNSIDMALGNMPAWATERGRMVMGEKVYEFSSRDYASGPGYLATPLGVMHQKGQDAVTTTITYEVTP